MRNISKKIMISVLTTIFVMFTLFATTYAWVGIFTYSSADEFEMNLKVEDLKQDYFLTISNTGVNGTFSDSVSNLEIKRQILINRGISSPFFDVATASDDDIETLFEREARLESVTTNIDDNNRLEEFTRVDYDTKWKFQMIESKDYYKMDVYLSVDTKEGITESTEVNSNVFISDIMSTLTGEIATHQFINGNPFGELPSDSQNDILKNIPVVFNTNSVNAARFALSIYEPININDSYDNSSVPLKTLIFQGGTQDPSYDNETDTYNLGGNLPEDYNAALHELLYIRPNYNQHARPEFNQYFYDCIDVAVERGRNELELLEENSLIWQSPDTFENNLYLGVYNGNQTKMKIEIYFWFEGWDADCLKGISKKSVDFNLKFSAHNDKYNN